LIFDPVNKTLTLSFTPRENTDWLKKHV
jgi:hypothetical protein